MNILVTGGAGFIGSHVADAQLKAGHEVHILDDLSSGKRENISEDAVLHELDIRNAEVEGIWEENRFEVLVHHAAQMDVRRSVADPSFDADVNLRGFLNLMEAGRKHGLRKVVFASTGGAIYGEPDYTPQDEKHPLRPLSPYGITKLATEKYLFFYEQEYGIPYVALRYGNIYGPRQNPHGEAGVIAIFIDRLLTERQPVIYGDGKQTRDYVYVGDVVAANMAALNYDGSGIFNVGTGRETDVNTLFRLLRDEISPDVPEHHEAGRPGEQRRSVLDFSKIESVLGWKPAVSIEAGLSETVSWFREKETSAKPTS
ncbi:MAG: GDP-mannose 4,6-dehydratase [Rhodothermia bacterium]|nr:GDP-mannose 4,6-dehydratase [Rhodothermia bacterium]